MPGLDVRTVVAVSVVISFTVGVTFGAATLNLRSGNRAVLWWAAAILLRALGFAGIFLRGTLPDFLSQPVANALLLSGAALFFAGIRASLGTSAEAEARDRLGRGVSFAVAVPFPWSARL